MQLRRRHTQDDERGQALMIVVAVMAVAALLIGATQLAVISDINLTSASLNIEKAQQAAQSGLADYEAWVKASSSDWAYATSYCSSNVAVGGYCPSTATGPDANNPAYDGAADQHCTTSASTNTGNLPSGTPASPGSKYYRGWESVRGANSQSEQFQYVVDSSQATSNGGYVHLFVTGRAGTSGRYTCRTIKVFYQGPSTSLINQSVLAPAACGVEKTPLTETAPAGANFMQITATGGTGDAGGNVGISAGGSLGGIGGTVQSTYAVTPGSLFYVAQGCQGGGSHGTADGGLGFANGGASSLGGVWGNAGGGGGATAVCAAQVGAAGCTAAAVSTLSAGTTNVQNDVYVIAGGGGGGGESLIWNGGDGANGDDSTINTVPGSATATQVTAGSNAVDVTTFNATTTVASPSNNVNVSSLTGAGTLTVSSLTGFPISGTLNVATASGTQQVAYTGTATSGSPNTYTFTGCTVLNNGVGVMSTGGTVSFDGVLNVASTTGFPFAGTLNVQTNVGGVVGYVTVTYTGTTPTSFTGCTTTGTGTLATGYNVVLSRIGLEDDGNTGTAPSVGTAAPGAGGTGVVYNPQGGVGGKTLNPTRNNWADGGGGGGGFVGGAGGQNGFAGAGGGSGASFCNTNLGWVTGHCYWSKDGIAGLGYGDVSIQWLSTISTPLGNPVVPSNCGPAGYRDATISPLTTVTINAQGGNGGSGDNADIIALGGALTAGGSGASITASYTNSTPNAIDVTAIQGCSGVIGAFDGGDPGGPGLGNGGYNVRCGVPPGVCGLTSRVFSENTSPSGGSGSGGGASALCVGTSTTADNCMGSTTVAAASDGVNAASLSANTTIFSCTAGPNCSNGVNVNTFTGSGILYVTSTGGFQTQGTLNVATSGGIVQLTYTGISGNTFTGVNLIGSVSGTMASGGAVTFFGVLNVASTLGLVPNGTITVQEGTATISFNCTGSTLTSYTGCTALPPANSNTTIACYSPSMCDNNVNVNSLNGSSDLYVGATNGFPTQGTLDVATASGTMQVSYTGLASNAFTGVGALNGGNGVMSTGGYVAIADPLAAGSVINSLSPSSLLLLAGGGGGGAETGCILSFSSWGLSDPGSNAGIGSNWSGGSSTTQPQSGVVNAKAGGGPKDGTPGGSTFDPGGGWGTEDPGTGAGDGGGGGDGYQGGGGGQVGSCFIGFVPDPGSGGGGGGSSYLSPLNAGLQLTTCAAGTTSNCSVLGKPNSSSQAIDEALWSPAAANSNGAIGITETATQVPPGVIYQQPTGGGTTW